MRIIHVHRTFLRCFLLRVSFFFVRMRVRPHADVCQSALSLVVPGGERIIYNIPRDTNGDRQPRTPIPHPNELIRVRRNYIVCCCVSLVRFKPQRHKRRTGKRLEKRLSIIINTFYYRFQSKKK